MKKASAFAMARHVLETPECFSMSKILYIDYPFYVEVEEAFDKKDFCVYVEDRSTGEIFQFSSEDPRKCIQNATPEALVKRVQKKH